MSKVEDTVARHYTHGTLSEIVRGGLEKLGAETDTNPIDLLAAVDEFHMGGRPATKALAQALQFEPGSTVLDIGCGLGGTARFLATTYQCQAVGIDLTPEYISVGEELNEDLGLTDQISLHVASALDLPLADAQFDRACMLHVGMNIQDKQKLMQEAARVIRPGGYFGVYDVMRTGDAPIIYPVAWAEDEGTSFVSSITDYRQTLEAAGFEIMDVIDKRDVAISFFEAIMARLAQGGPPPLGLHIVMGNNAKIKVKNMFTNVQNGTVSPVQIIAKRT
ncbi:SAM-dependent methyltransferase [Sulfitobacter sp. SK012]|uniref:class I SAM-dependent methyltransferase n=1 Tax=Sulfitobacter sp. SK012 TaxID=1389005 RepID=UPI000E0C6160|nr:methyltransferase domain-containing protein [Sulfitobacter sp. SK012]AXI46679.1 SAM-dependent methyltransferase [Sulfitobacter sp. SK012]